MTVTIKDASGRVIVQGDASVLGPGYTCTTDCHGTTFAEGQVWIDDPQVPKLLKGDGYIETATPRPGDIGVYSSDGRPRTAVHSVRVTAVEAETGRVTQVYGKGGITPPARTAPGPGPGTGWHDPKVKLKYYRKKPMSP